MGRHGAILEASWAIIGRSCGPLGPSRAVGRPKRSNSQNPSNTYGKPMNFASSGPSWRTSWTPLGPSWMPLGRLLGPLGPSWRLLGRTWRHLGPSWAVLEAILDHLGRTWRPSWPSWRPSWAILEPSGAGKPSQPALGIPCAPFRVASGLGRSPSGSSLGKEPKPKPGSRWLSWASPGAPGLSKGLSGFLMLSIAL